MTSREVAAVNRFKTAVNWDASAVAASLHLVALSIKNITAYLSLANGVQQADFGIPDPSAFEVASRRVGLQSMSMSTATGHIQSTTKEQLLVQIKKTTARQLARVLIAVANLRSAARPSILG
ncbi:hypothetical protein EJO68_33355 [Variovorax atrisoli]|uniref:hypothetical protein n=1 Tax=Variovorax atrisoli TaxID=3394203 RepID=UPI000F7F9DEF|nr:hypothetical protein [Variovorax sp. 369]RTD84026.1 hypothetical protein EJO68_33355 [Variovorax sp. 369]